MKWVMAFWMESRILRGSGMTASAVRAVRAGAWARTGAAQSRMARVRAVKIRRALRGDIVIGLLSDSLDLTAGVAAGEPPTKQSVQHDLAERTPARREMSRP
jgi:hypothetical protein